LKTVLIIGAGGVGRVVTHKTAQNRGVFEKIVLASRTLSKCEKIASEIDSEIITDIVDADITDNLSFAVDVSYRKEKQSEPGNTISKIYSMLL